MSLQDSQPPAAAPQPPPRASISSVGLPSAGPGMMARHHHPQMNSTLTQLLLAMNAGGGGALASLMMGGGGGGQVDLSDWMASLAGGGRMLRYEPEPEPDLSYEALCQLEDVKVTTPIKVINSLARAPFVACASTEG